ncbi:TonB-dependent receptor plug domain-containing protein [Neolewinella aurantiaca]|uniref:TonB-dependent receptor plug domain-containing protein n=1 Tax=Neolewinella aurantiaca TaxID=2602767 RepID=UPI001650AD8F|nr:TonB-dependent receptor [Neolewinella aurantiaca]
MNYRALGILLTVIFFYTAASVAQDTLRITDAAGVALPFANVLLYPEEISIGPADEEGRVILKDDFAPEQVFRISYLGYEDVLAMYRDLQFAGFVYAFDDTQITLAMPEVIGRRNETARDMPYQTEAIGRSVIAKAQSLTTADALADLSGVFVQKSQFGGGSPIVRGFEANRVLLVVDGVRMNNAIFRNGHLQNAISVDPLALDRLELIYGAGALAYGSDAIGGVVHFRTQQPDFHAGTQDAKWGVQGAMSVSSAAKAFSQGVRIEYSRRNFAALTLLSTSFTSDLRAGAQRPSEYPAFGLRNEYVSRIDGQDRILRNERPNEQIGTGYNQYNFLQKLRFRLKNELELNANLQYSTTSDIPRYDALTERRNDQLRWARWDYGPQARALASLQLSDRRATKIYDIATYLISHQFIQEDRIQRPFGDPQEENSLVDVHATNLQTDFTKALNELTFHYGFDLRYDQVKSETFLRNIETGDITTVGQNSRYPSAGSSLLSGGLYAEASQQLGANLQLRGGVRWSRQRLNARFGADDPVAWPEAYLAGISNTESAVTGTLGLIHDTGNHRLRTLFAQGFRAPNIDDFAKFRESNGFIQVPNPALQPERSNTLEAGYQYVSADNAFRAGATVYHTWLSDAIIRRDGTLPDGSRSFVSRGDTLFVQTNVNAERAKVYGFDVDASLKFITNWWIETAFHFVRGRRDQLAPDGNVLTLPQDHIPPPYGNTGVGWARGPWDLSFRLRYQFAKEVKDYAVGEISGNLADGYILDRSGTADNLELTPLASDGQFNYTGVYSWWTANLYAEYRLNDHFTFRIKGENLLDRHYRTFGSGVSAAGLDLGIGLSCQW